MSEAHGAEYCADGTEEQPAGKDVMNDANEFRINTIRVFSSLDLLLGRLPMGAGK